MGERIQLVLLALALVTLFAPPAKGEEAFTRFLRVRDGKVITFSRMFSEIRTADIVFVGESHGNMKDHAGQLAIIRAFHESAFPVAIGLEMFRAESQRELDRWIEGKAGLDAFLKVYYDNWNMPWPLYGSIFLYAQEHVIPMIGLNLPDGIVKKVAQKGFAALTPEERRQLPAGISCNVDPTYMDFIRKVYGKHDGGKSFSHFCEAQVVWDKTMAFHLVEYLGKNRGRTVVVLAGAGHSWKRGIPEHVREFSKYRTVVIMPDVPEQTNRTALTTADADYLALD
jgi:uncharacterized iron-regulated protein